MTNRRVLLRALLLASAAVLAACGGGGGGGKDVFTAAPPPPVITDPNIFLLFPNPQLQADGTRQTDTVEYAQAYYAAVDPLNERDTLAKFKAKNGFDTGIGAQVRVVFGDMRDLGYGRLMTGRRNPDGTIAFFVQNYLVEAAAGYTYSSANLDAAVAQAGNYHIGTNAIEFSPGPAGGVKFLKFYTYRPDGTRRLTADMDGRGEKAIPGPCITCHGGRGDALTPPAAGGARLFNLVQNLPSGNRGDVQARFNVFELDHFDFSAQPGFTRADFEAGLKQLNRWVLESYPIAAPTAFPEDASRRVAQVNEWQGTSAALIKNAYGGDGLPSATYSDTLVPAGWAAVGQTTLYQNVVAESCRACHSLRGNGSNSQIDFDSYQKFVDYADRIKAHVFDRGNMPLSRLVYQKLVSTNAINDLANFLQGQGFTVRDAGGAVLKVPRPVADPGPDRVVLQGATSLSASMSLYSSSYQWSVVSGPNGVSPPTNVTLTNPSTASPTFNATANGTYIVQLISSNGSTQSTPALLRIEVNNALAPAPAAIRFVDIKGVLQGGAAGCTGGGCHVPGGNAPVIYGTLAPGSTDVDRNGDGVVNATDDLWFYTEIRSRINFTDLAASPLLRKPSFANQHHNGGLAVKNAGFDTSVPVGNPARASYDMFVNWILNGAPQ